MAEGAIILGSPDAGNYKSNKVWNPDIVAAPPPRKKTIRNFQI